MKTQTSIEEIERLAAAVAAAGELDVVNALYQTALHLAVITNQPNIASHLVSRGTSLRPQEQLHGDTVLHLACRLPGRGECLSAITDAYMRRTTNQPNKLDIKSILHSTNFVGTPKIKLNCRIGL